LATRCCPWAATRWETAAGRGQHSKDHCLTSSTVGLEVAQENTGPAFLCWDLCLMHSGCIYTA
jgi:hypothetical protein